MDFLFLSVAHCAGPPKPNEDELDKALRKVHTKVQEVSDDVKEAVDQKAEEAWNLIREKYISKPVKESLDFMAKILGERELLRLIWLRQ